ncbi:hypothetical protein E4U42_004701 [Claviceps africana]|uniref:NAD-dependent epimerase/dehydratase domain-containing protein n=1 Tax=Claviceps africana TaxID=83212 RepID=A0A8K0J4W0_9HYPO|nr:hypothetical protein E4U42_004701 [Claviceps africana]
MALVLVTAHILKILLGRGYHVVTTVRSEDKAKSIEAAFPEAKLRVVIVPDMAAEGAFDEVAQTAGLEYVLHNAKTELLDPAIRGTRSILQSMHAFAPQVRRVVITSSLVSVTEPSAMKDASKVFDESDWNPITYEQGLAGDKAAAYRASKTMAERSAWQFVDEARPRFDVVTLCPPLVFGPVAHALPALDGINTSNQRFVDLVQGKWRREILPTLGANFFVDVRDLASAHVAAMETAEAGGKRFLCSGGRFCDREIVEAARRAFPQLGALLPPEDAPGGDYPAVMSAFDSSLATKILRVEWTGIERCAVDTIQSLLAVGS